MTAIDRNRPAVRRARRTPLTWIRGGGVSNLLFLLPMLLILSLIHI